MSLDGGMSSSRLTQKSSGQSGMDMIARLYWLSAQRLGLRELASSFLSWAQASPRKPWTTAAKPTKCIAESVQSVKIDIARRMERGRGSVH